MRRLLVLLVPFVTACREAPAPFAPENPFANETSRLTFNLKDDRTPIFNTSDTVLYVAESYPPFLSSRGLVLGVERTASVARPIMQAVQVGVPTQPWLSAPMLSNDAGSVAFFQITVATDQDWDFVTCPPGVDAENTNSVLQQAVLRVRRLDSQVGGDDARLVVNFEGRTLDSTRHPFFLPYVIVNIAHPFHQQFERHDIPVFRASWSPDGTKLVFSDGLQLRIWTIGQPASTVIANTEDAVLPAWSPDGAWIAYTRLFRGPTQNVTCEAWVAGSKMDTPAAVFDRTIYPGVTRDNGELVLIRPDGTEQRSLGLGEAPAWSPDGRFIVVHRDGQLFKVAEDGSSAVPIPDTGSGFEPAVSPDGGWVAFAKLVSPSNHDIWVAPF